MFQAVLRILLFDIERKAGLARIGV